MEFIRPKSKLFPELFPTRVKPGMANKMIRDLGAKLYDEERMTVLSLGKFFPAEQLASDARDVLEASVAAGVDELNYIFPDKGITSRNIWSAYIERRYEIEHPDPIRTTWFY